MHEKTCRATQDLDREVAQRSLLDELHERQKVRGAVVCRGMVAQNRIPPEIRREPQAGRQAWLGFDRARLLKDSRTRTATRPTMPPVSSPMASTMVRLGQSRSLGCSA